MSHMGWNVGLSHTTAFLVVGNPITLALHNTVKPVPHPINQLVD